MKESGRAIDKYQPLWGSWKVEELIGQGRGVEVYKASKEEWGKKYISTVKLMSFSVGKSDIKEAQAIGISATEMPEYFKSLVGNIRNEIELMYRLRGNSNIVTYEDHGIYEQKGDLGWDVLIRMEFLQPLPDFLSGQGLTRLDVVKLGIDICKALEVCGREGIIHRDIKDSSIFVSPRGEYKLGSFSMAKELSKGGRTALTLSNPLYMAPELYNEQSYDSSIDIYSLGIVMYKLLNRGRLPFLPLPPEDITAEDTESSIARRMSGESLLLPADAGDSLGDIILKACSFDKKDRYKSPHEFRRKLERFLKTEMKSSNGDSLQTGEVFVYVAADNEEAASKSAEADIEATEESPAESTGTAIVETAASIDKRGNTRKGAGKRLALTIVVCAALMILAFILGYSMNYYYAPVPEEPIAKKADADKAEETNAVQTPTTAATPTPEPEKEKTGEEYYKEGLAHMESNRNELAIAAFQEAKKLGYDSTKADSRINMIRKRIEVQQLSKKAADYYELHEYEKAIETYAALAKTDASYKSSNQYADSYFKLAEEHNSLGMEYFSEGKLEQSLKEFDVALSVLEKMKKNLKGYDTERYARWNSIYDGNKSSMQEKIQKISDHMKLADECNRAGVQYFNEGYWKKAKTEFERALEHLEEVRRISPKYSANGYEGMIKIYEGNLKRANSKM